MASLTIDVNRVFEYPEESNSILVAAGAKIYEGSLVGLEPTGYGRALVARDIAIGFAKDNIDNSDGSDGDQNAELKSMGKVSLFISGLTPADIGKGVYATDDNTFTLIPTDASYVGKVIRFEKADYGIVAFNFLHSKS